jgi:large subunit ribosomal protein L5
MARLKQYYEETVREELSKQFAYENRFSIPKVVKVVVSMGVGQAVQDQKKIDAAFDNLRMIAGQQPVKTRARKSISSFKLREGVAIGTMVTLRKDRMYEFLDRLINIALPRIKDFRGLSPRGFDGNGNYSFGVKEQIIFPEIDYDKVDMVRGLNISIVTNAKTDDEARALLRCFDVPFHK